MTNFFSNKGVKDGDPISIGMFVLFMFIIWKWFTTASITPVPSITAKYTQLPSLLSAFNFLLIVLIPLTILILIVTISEESHTTQPQEYHGILERVVTKQSAGVIQRIAVRREAKKKRMPYVQDKSYNPENIN